jgi:hypothetical protein
MSESKYIIGKSYRINHINNNPEYTFVGVGILISIDPNYNRGTFEFKLVNCPDCEYGYFTEADIGEMVEYGSLTNLNELLNHAIKLGESEVADFIRYKIYQEEKKS